MTKRLTSIAKDKTKAAATRASERFWLKNFSKRFPRGISRGSPHFPSPVLASTETVSWVGAEDKSAQFTPCTGVSSSIEFVNDPSVLPSGSAALYAVWNALPEFANSVWAQTGYYVQTGSAYYFYQIWNLDENAVETTGAAVLSAPGNHTFQIIYSGTGTTWDFYLDGVLMGSYDLGESSTSGVTTSQPFEALVEKQVYSTDPAWDVPTVSFPIAFQSQVGGKWVDIAPGTATEIGDYGVQGQLQNGSLPADSITVGSAIATVPSGTTLWDAAPAPSNTVTLSGTISAQANAGEPVTANVINPDGTTAVWDGTTTSTDTWTAVGTTTQTGAFKATATVAKDSKYEAATSAEYSFTVS